MILDEDWIYFEFNLELFWINFKFTIKIGLNIWQILGGWGLEGILKFPSESEWVIQRRKGASMRNQQTLIYRLWLCAPCLRIACAMLRLTSQDSIRPFELPGRVACDSDSLIVSISIVLFLNWCFWGRSYASFCFVLGYANFQVAIDSFES